MTPPRLWPSIPFVCVLLASPANAQIDLYPRTVQPAEWERFALRAINQTDTAFVAVRLTVPDAVMILGVERPNGWEFRIVAGSDTTPQMIEWTGGELARGEFLEFAFLGRVVGDARERDLVFPVGLTRKTGSLVTWDRRSDTGPAPIVRIVGTATVSAWGSLALAGAAAGLAVLALALALAKRRTSG